MNSSHQVIALYAASIHNCISSAYLINFKYIYLYFKYAYLIVDIAYMCTYPVRPDDCCFGKLDGTPHIDEGNRDKLKTSDKDTVSASDTTGNTVPSTRNTVGDTVTNVSDKIVGQRTVTDISSTCVATTASDTIADTPGVDRATIDTPSDATSNMFSDTTRENQTSIEAEGDTVSEIVEEETAGNSSKVKSSGVVPCDKSASTEDKNDTTNSTACDTQWDKRADKE